MQSHRMSPLEPPSVPPCGASGATHSRGHVANVPVSCWLGPTRPCTFCAFIHPKDILVSPQLGGDDQTYTNSVHT